MDAVGVGLSALALFLECLKAYNLLSTAQCLSSDLRVLKTKFQIEETRLIEWGLYWGYRSSPSESTLNANLDNAGQTVASTVKLTLQQISTLLKKYDAVSAKYDNTARSQSMRSMVWALKDKATLESTVFNLNGFNNALHQLLPKKEEASLAQVVACAMTKRYDGSELDELIAATASLQYVDAAKLARFKRAYQLLALEEGQQSPLSLGSTPSTLLLDASRFQLSNRHSSEARTLADFDSSLRVIVEWKGYHPGLLSGSATARMTLRHRVSHLAELMSHRTQRPEGFNILTCISYFDQASLERFGFAYSFPPGALAHMPFTLHELLINTGMPALGKRFKMALSLAKTLNLLHSSGWLHKSIRPNNIAIFQALETNIPDLESPYLLGFGYSRPDGHDEETFLEQSAVASINQLYRHPEVQGQHPRRYMASDDIYSLGLVLLEIALWAPLVDIEGRKGVNCHQEPLNIEKIMKSVSSLPKRVGTIYKEAVEKCLNIGQVKPQPIKDLSAAEWNAERLRNQNLFYWDVVKRLEECKA
ncbi:hypothetical protein FQN57_001142 [Myotisia sp. PD_48]|nr:hypothetical protein FQN57_001142 [Myotisia sp. PD_48]